MIISIKGQSFDLFSPKLTIKLFLVYVTGRRNIGWEYNGLEQHLNLRTFRSEKILRRLIYKVNSIMLSVFNVQHDNQYKMSLKRFDEIHSVDTFKLDEKVVFLHQFWDEVLCPQCCEKTSLHLSRSETVLVLHPKSGSTRGISGCKKVISGITALSDEDIGNSAVIATLYSSAILDDRFNMARKVRLRPHLDPCHSDLCFSNRRKLQ